MRKHHILHDEYLALFWIMIVAIIDVFHLITFEYKMYVTAISLIKLILSFLYIWFMVYYAYSSSNKTLYFHIIVLISLLLSAVCLFSNYFKFNIDHILIPVCLFLFPYFGIEMVLGSLTLLCVLLFQLILFAIHYCFSRLPECRL